MDTNTHPPAQFYTPPLWRARWYRIQRRLRGIFRRPRFDVNKAFRSMLRRGYRKGRQVGYTKGYEDGLSAGVALAARQRLFPMCQHHPTMPLYCPLCAPFMFRQQSWMPEPPEPVTDPHMLPAKRYTAALAHGAGQQTAMRAALPRYTTRPLTPHTEKRER